MMRTAISPRLAIRIFWSKGRPSDWQSYRYRDARWRRQTGSGGAPIPRRAPVRVHRLDQPLPAGRSPIRRPRGPGRGCRQPGGGAGPRELPDELKETATALNHVAGSWVVDRDALLDRILAGLEARYAPLVGPRATKTAPTADMADAAGSVERARERARRELASEYRRRCSTVGRAVRVELADETFTGTAVDISEQGQLMVDVGTCTRAVTAGDVVHLRALS